MGASVKSLISMVLLQASFLLAPVFGQINPTNVLLKDYKPKSIFNIPQTRVEKARFPVIDVHSHAYYGTNAAGVDRWVKIMDDVNLERSIILSGATGKRFDEIAALFSKYPRRFQVWCGLETTNCDQPGWSEQAVAELIRCQKNGARGVGELHDKGRGLNSPKGMHCDDPRLDPFFDKCGELGLPVNIHIGEDQWMYEPMDEHNDGLMNAFTWNIPNDPAVLRHDEVLATLDRMVAKHPRTTIIACHLANCCADLTKLATLLDKYPNLYADIGARFSELTAIPRTIGRFFAKYQDLILYGTDNTPNPEMYRTSFRILETDDEHFYPTNFSKYHWPSHAFALPEDILKKVYRENAVRILHLGQ
jgi:predicted TIM-barrel fold metal-dependent hydrolase